MGNGITARIMLKTGTIKNPSEPLEVDVWELYISLTQKNGINFIHSGQREVDLTALHEAEVPLTTLLPLLACFSLLTPASEDSPCVLISLLPKAYEIYFW